MRTPASKQRAELVDLIEKFTGKDGEFSTGIRSLRLTRYSEDSPPQHDLLQPALCMVAQSEKQVLLGDNVFQFDPKSCLVVPVELPLTAMIQNASPRRPYLGLRVALDPTQIGSLIEQAGMRPPESVVTGLGIYTQPVSSALLDAVLRLLRLLDSPDEIPVLAPLIEREILFRLLLQDRDGMLYQMGTSESQTRRIAEAIAQLRSNFTKRLFIGKLARKANMSLSGFHQWFKLVTSMSPLQYQKLLRLQEARRILLHEHVSVGTASYRVGYESPSQFSREYHRLFGRPPAQEIRQRR
jgi:AraC-like DNA-binding protein